MPNFSSLAGLKVPEKSVVGWWGGGEHVSTMSNPRKLLLSCFELRWVLTIDDIEFVWWVGGGLKSFSCQPQLLS